LCEQIGSNRCLHSTALLNSSLQYIVCRIGFSSSIDLCSTHQQRNTNSANMSDDQRRNRVFIGGISDRIQKEDIEREFAQFGKLTNVWVAQNPPGFAFVEYDHISEADLAVAEMNGKSFLSSLNKIR